MNRVEWELYGETNVDQVVDKTNKGLGGIEKNAKRVENAFAMSISSIFLRFLGPMALLQAAISWISGAIEESKQAAKEAQDLAVKGESQYVKAEDAYLARKYAAEDAAKKEQELAQVNAAQNAQRFLEEEGNGAKVMEKLGLMGWLKYGISTTGYAAQQEDVQKAVRELTAEEMAKPENALKSIKTGDFKGPEGFSNVVGVGASPVLEAMTQQLDIQKEMLVQLEIANAEKGGNTDFTKWAAKNQSGF